MSKLEFRSANAPGSVGRLAGRINYRTDSAPLTGNGRASFIERIEPGAFTETLSSKTSVVLTAGHRSDDPLAVLARWPSGGLTLRDTAEGLEWEAVLPDTTAAKDIVQLVRSGAINSHSFEFSIRPGGDRWERSDDIDRRFITSASLLEIN